ncbi:phosphoribosylformylglycinamidine cyclo-ligase [Naumannella halotolerans]|uniref:Phosphoribosylformylglycinamidine cyclo-ligase n=1 Tax=Naumannella halotolerans TaxID=993414 RepID=A0A4R7JAC0_9ACTN|nr:phosphoribosylformylglycinamidine cyclo-ligase [Naumannella halotolerans]TDT34500.1 phosphoribosylformylglycinamidine cyclo-ligase [Naumannella halotolerans]
MTKSAYAAAGVDIEAGERAVALMKDSVARTQRPEVLGGLGGFAGFFDAAALKGYDHPVLATSTDGVGTKVAIAQALDVHDTIGIDLVAMLVDDLVVCGAEPLFVTDYIACGVLEPERIAAIVDGIATGCEEAGAALLGGETAEHPGLLDPDEYDVAGATTGVVERDRILGAGWVRSGDVLIAMESSGLHSNGYSLVRHVLAESGIGLEDRVPGAGKLLGEELLVPTRIYTKACLELARTLQVHAMSHITGGGLANNLARVLPGGTGAKVDRATWRPAPIFDFIGRTGSVDRLDLEATLNMGVGMVAVVAPADADAAVELLGERGVPAWVCGTVEAGLEGVELIGDHPAG